MQRNTSIILGNHFSDFIGGKIKEGRFESISEAVRAGLRLLEENENKLEILRRHIAEGEVQADRGEFVKNFSMSALIKKLDEEKS